MVLFSGLMQIFQTTDKFQETGQDKIGYGNLQIEHNIYTIDEKDIVERR